MDGRYGRFAMSGDSERTPCTHRGHAERHAFLGYFDQRSCRNNPVAPRVQAGPLRPDLVGGGEAIRPSGSDSFAAIPPFEVIPAFGGTVRSRPATVT